MAVDLKAATTDALRLQNYRARLQGDHETQVRELEERQLDSLNRIQENHTDRKESLVSAYNVEISKEAEQLEDRLTQIRAQNEQRVAEEKRIGDQELAKTKLSNQQRIDEYKKTAEKKLDAMRKELQANAENLRLQYKKSAKRQGQEVSES